MSRTRSFKLMIVVLLCYITVACSQQQTLTKKDVRIFYENLVSAMNNRDVDAVLSCISENVESNMTTITPDGTQNMTLTKHLYAVNMRKTFEVADSYTYRIEEIKIDLADDKHSAIVVLRAVETITLQDQTIHALVDGENEIRVIDGKLQAVRIDGVVKVEY